jgi:DNA modification methylase
VLKPYYDADGITIYNAACEDVLPQLGQFDLLLTDPPYGIGADTDAFKKRGQKFGNAAAPKKDYGQSNWDEKPVDRAFLDVLIAKASKSVIFGGNYFGLPASSCWLVWDKDNGDNHFADCELAWTNFDCAVRMFKYRWNGMIQQDMKAKENRVHPTQKPTRVMEWCLSFAPEAKTVLDPFMGSGTTLVAAKQKGLRAVGIEREEKYCAAAVERLRQGILIPV